MKVVIVGEAWGRHEEQMSHALVGPSGRELTLELGISGLAPFMQIQCHECKEMVDFTDGTCDNCKSRIWPNEFHLLDYWKKLRTEHGIAVTNVFNRRPFALYNFPDIGWSTCKIIEDRGKFSKIKRLSDDTEHTVITKSVIQNDLGGFFSPERQTPMPPWKASKIVSGTHLKREFFHHVESLWTEIRDLDPTLILCLGNAACWAILGQTKITALRGTVSMSAKDLTGFEKKCLATFHPAAVLRAPPMRASVIPDLTKAKREAEFPEIRRPERWLTIPSPNEAGIKEGYEWLKRPTQSYSCDIETIKRQISIIGFGRSPSDALVIPFRDANVDNQGHIVEVGKIATDLGFPSTNINYWPTPELEFEAWKLAIAALQSDKEKIFQNGIYDLSYMVGMGIFPKNIAHDTMLWHHSRFIELPKSLGFLGSIYCNEISWKQMSRHSNSLKRDE